MLSLLLQQPISLRVLIFTLGLAVNVTLSADKLEIIRPLALALSFVGLAIGTVSCRAFDKSSLGFQFLARLEVLPQYNLAFSLGVDGVSRTLLRLTLFTFPLCFLAA